MKKTKHVLINLTEREYETIIQNANKENRNITNYCYLLIVEGIKNDVKYN